jgi:hypothetical protein
VTASPLDAAPCDEVTDPLLRTVRPVDRSTGSGSNPRARIAFRPGPVAVHSTFAPSPSCSRENGRPTDSRRVLEERVGLQQLDTFWCASGTSRAVTGSVIAAVLGMVEPLAGLDALIMRRAEQVVWEQP